MGKELLREDRGVLAVEEVSPGHRLDRVVPREHASRALVVDEAQIGIVEAQERDGGDAHLDAQRSGRDEAELPVIAEGGVEARRVLKARADRGGGFFGRCPLRRPASQDRRERGEVVLREAARRTRELVGEEVTSSPELLQRGLERARVRNGESDEL